MSTLRSPTSQRKKVPLTHLTIESMSLQEPRDQTQFQVCSHHMETSEELCKEGMVPALELGRSDWIH